MEINKYYVATFYAQFVVEKESFKEIHSLLAYTTLAYCTFPALMFMVHGCKLFLFLFYQN